MGNYLIFINLGNFSLNPFYFLNWNMSGLLSGLISNEGHRTQYMEKVCKDLVYPIKYKI